ncbi:EamA family transporter RarD [Pseudomonas sp. A-R-19]|uniref:EamA family transporter RarD n=1 Tax=Pseudomonas sp. A-R-19 TaxID=2832403 RepID=UPI001CBA8E65|nr:EamA family transporter RarD [Pseudomonas sp. A-R-19]
MLIHERQGYVLGLFAYLAWGLSPLFYKQLADLPPFEIVGQRIIWSAVFGITGLIIWRQGHRLSELRAHPGRLFVLVLCGLLVSSSQVIYIWAVNNHQIVEASMGYYISPLLNVLIGSLVLRERLRAIQWFSVFLAVVGVGSQVWHYGAVPWISLSLAACFSLYGVIRKQAKVLALPGMAMENLLLCPLAIAWLLTTPDSITGSAPYWGTVDAWWAVAVGPFTLIPLICFHAAARRVPYTTLGFLQYLSPTLMLLLAVSVFGEPLLNTTLTALSFIWAGLGLYSVDLWYSSRDKPQRLTNS